MIVKIFKKLFIDFFIFNIAADGPGATGDYSFAEGQNTKASGDFSHAEGNSTEASGSSSHAEGNSTEASGSYSHAEGYYTEASGDYSHAGGYYTVAAYNYQTTIGKFNSNKTDTIFEVGVGYDNIRSMRNALEVYIDGRIYAPELSTSEIIDGKCLVTKEYLFSAEFGSSLPTSDPGVDGVLWNDGGIVKVSEAAPTDS